MSPSGSAATDSDPGSKLSLALQTGVRDSQTKEDLLESIERQTSEKVLDLSTTATTVKVVTVNYIAELVADPKGYTCTVWQKSHGKVSR